MAVAVGRAGAGLPSPRGAVSTFILLGLMILVGYVGVNLLYARVKPSPEQIFGSLGTARFTQPLPAVMADMRVSLRADDEENYVAVALNTPVKPEGFEGDEARISYLVLDNAAAARADFDEILADARLQAQRDDGGKGAAFEFGSLPGSDPNYCFGFGQRLHYCQMLVGSVWIDITSYIEIAGVSDDPYFSQLARTALDHLRSSVPGVD